MIQIENKNQQVSCNYTSAILHLTISSLARIYLFLPFTQVHIATTPVVWFWWSLIHYGQFATERINRPAIQGRQS